MVDKIWYNMEELIGGSEERGINRNIVECKGNSGFPDLHQDKSINRNIVECKEKFIHKVQLSTTGINRNIVECKDNFS